MRKWYCFFSAQYLPTMGGVERYTYQLAKQLIQKGNRVTVITSNTHSLPTRETVEGIEIYRLPCWSLLKGRFPIIRHSPAFFRLAAQLRAELHPDFIFVNTRFYPLSLYGVRFAFRAGIPAAVLEHGTAHLTVGNAFFDTLGQWFEHGITARIKRYCHFFFGVSNACNDWLRHFRITASGTMYNAIDLPGIEALCRDPAEDYRGRFGIPENAVVIAFTGRLVPEKGVLPLVEAVTLVREQTPDVYLLMAGTGPLEEALRAKETAYIRLLGQIDFPHVAALLRQSDIFCLPSESEGFPTSVLEAAACGCYIITTEKGGAKELIPDESFGVILPDNRTELLVQTLLRVLPQKKERAAAAAKAHKRLEENFTWDIVSDRAVSLVQKTVGENVKEKEE